MMRSVIPLVVSLGSLAAAINITSPAANTTYAAGSTVAVRWTSVDTDPTNFSLYLWNFVSWPPTYVPLALDIPTADLSYSVQIPCDTNPEWGYQISGINGTNVYIIFAQGDKFTVSEPVEPCVDPAPVPTPSTCPSAGASTVYVTVSPTGSSSRLFHPSSSHVSSSPLPSTTTTTTTSSATSKYVKPGIVPKTIGWCSDYAHPVTLDKVPTPTPAPIMTPAPGEGSGGRGPRVKTITTTVSVEACPIDAM